jgi:CRP-like cAMP-binding protein
MLSPLYTYLNNVFPLSEEIIDNFEKNFEFIELPKNEYLLRDGETCNYIYVIISGLVRMFYIKDGEEICSMFIEENAPFNAPDSYYSRKPGYTCLQTLTPTTVARIHYDRLQHMYERHPDLNYAGRVITERYFVKSEERLYLLRKQSAEERYQYFLENYPQLLQKVPLKFIASYLGITNETLSRIRNKISR